MANSAGLRTALADRDEARRRAKRAEEIAAERYSLEVFQRRTAELIERIG